MELPITTVDCLDECEHLHYYVHVLAKYSKDRICRIRSVKIRHMYGVT